MNQHVAAFYIDNALDMTLMPLAAVDTEFGSRMTTEHAPETITATSILECLVIRLIVLPTNAGVLKLQSNGDMKDMT